MADIIVKIAINPAGGGEIGSVATSHSELLNNISIKADDSGVFEVLTTDNFQGTEMLAFDKGVLHFNKSGFLSNRKYGEAGRLQSLKQPRQYVWGRTDDNGYALDKNGNIVELVLTLESTGSTVNFDSIVIVGDSVAQQFPVEAYLDDSTEPIYSDDAKWAIRFEENKPSHTIRIVRWNRPNYNAVINAVRVMYKYINIGDRALQSINSLSETSSDVSTINYGTIANSGSIQILDANGEIEDLIRDGILPNSNVGLEVEYNGNVIQHHITNDSDYKSDTKEFNVSLSNKAKDLDILKYQGYPYPNEPRSLYDILFDVMKSLISLNLTETDFNLMLSNKYFYSVIELGILINHEDYIYNYLKNIIVNYPIIQAGKTYREVIDEICTVAQLRMFVNDNNEYEFVLARPISLTSDRKVLIEPKIIYDEPTSDVIVKNKFQAVEIEEYEVVDEIDYNTIIHSETVSLERNFNAYKMEEINNYNSLKYTSVATSADYRCVSFIQSKYYYMSGELTINKNTNQNLSQILSVREFKAGDDSEGFSSYQMRYEKNNASIKGVLHWDGNQSDLITLNGSIAYSGALEYNGSAVEQGIIEDKNDAIFSITSGGYTQEIPVSSSTKPIAPVLTIIDGGDYYKVLYTICVGKEIFKLSGYKGYNDIYTAKLDIDSTGTYEQYIPVELNLSIYGNKKTISFKNISVSSDNINNESTKASVVSSYLLQSKTIFNGKKISDIIKENIMTDYSNGIRSKSFKVICHDMKDNNGNIVIKKNIGQILNLNDIIFSKGDTYPNGSQVYWRIFSREFVYDGEPYLLINAEEAINYESGDGLINDYGGIIESWDSLVENGKVAVSDSLDADGLTLTAVEPSLEGIISVPLGFSEINYEAFRLSNLTKIILPDRLKYIRTRAFQSCSNLTNISIPDSIEVIEPNAFQYARLLKYNVIGDVNYLGNSKNPYLVLMSVAKTNKTYYSIIESTKIISDGAFANNSYLERMIIPSNTKKIPYNCFGNCTSLLQVVVEEGVEEIGDEAFLGCTSLVLITIPSTVKTIGERAFYGSKLQFLELPSFITEIKSQTFQECSQLQLVTIPSSVTKIGFWAFNGCSSLKEITIPASVKEISGGGTFYGCSSLTNVTFEDPTGWKADGVSVDLSDPVINVTYFTNTYVDANWIKL